jgi:hypothetical protein
MSNLEEERETAQAALDDAVTRLQEAATTLLRVTPPAGWRAALESLRKRIDTALATATADVGGSPIMRARFAADFPGMAAQQQRARKAKPDDETLDSK